jgi:Cu+-exporting ATPase
MSHGGMVPVYYEASVVMITLVILGQVLERRVRSVTLGAIRALLGLTPWTTRQVLDNGTEVEIPLEEVVVGNLLRVRPSEKFPWTG